MKITVLSLLVLTFAFATVAQTKGTPEENPRSARLGLIARADRDSIVLRWAPTKPGAWIIANRIGYQVERVRIQASGALDTAGFVRLTSAPLKPWTREEWLQKSPHDDQFAAIALQALHGRAFIPSQTGQSTSAVTGRRIARELKIAHISSSEVHGDPVTRETLMDQSPFRQRFLCEEL